MATGCCCACLCGPVFICICLLCVIGGIIYYIESAASDASDDISSSYSSYTSSYNGMDYSYSSYY